jgi:hypothetical protein
MYSSQMIHSLKEALLKNVDLSAMWLAIPDPQQADVTPEQYATALAELEDLQDPGCSVWDEAVRAYTQQHQQLQQQQQVLQALQQQLVQCS